MEPFQTAIRVRFSDVDYARVVYFPQVLHFFHCAYEEMLRHHGIYFPTMISQDGVGFPVVHVEVDYCHPLKVGDELIVRVQVKELRSKTTVIVCEGSLQNVSTGSDISVAKAQIHLACVNMKSFKSTEIPEKYSEVFSIYLKS